MTEFQVVERRTYSPPRAATTITRETKTHWWVACEVGCGGSVCQSKVTWEPATPADPGSLECIEVTHTAPAAARCADCTMSEEAPVTEPLEISVTMHPSYWRTIVDQLEQGRAATSTYVDERVKAGTMTPAEAAAWMGDIEMAQRPIMDALRAACDAHPTWRRWLMDEVTT